MSENPPSSTNGNMISDAAKKVDGLFASSRRSGSMNSVTDGTPLYYPSDLLAADNPNSENTNGIINWLEFRMFFKQNGGLESVVNKVSSAIGFGGQDDTKQSSETEGEVEQTQKEIGKYFDFDPKDAAPVTSDTRLSKGTESTNDSIFLYVPGGIEYNDSINYEETALAGIKNLSSASATASTVALGGLRKLAGMADKVGGALGQESLNTGAAISAELGVVMNPRKEQLFQGINMRTFSFSFVFIPRNEDEAKTVAEIIKVFRFHAHPELSANSAFFNFPSEFEIKYRTYNRDTNSVEDNPIVPKINRCFLDSIATNYTPDDVYYAFRNGMPPKITLTLSFKEAEYITRQHVNEGF